MTHDTARDTELGFTIQELLVVIIVGSLLVSFCLSLFLFAGRLFGNWQRKIEAQRLLGSALQTIALDMEVASSVTATADSMLVIDRGRGKQVIYLLRSDSVARSGEPLFGLELASGRFLEAGGFNLDETNHALYRVELAYSSKGSTFTVACDVSPPRSSLGQFNRLKASK